MASMPPRALRNSRPYDEVTAFDWDSFVARWWERRVVVFRATGATPFALPEVFAAAAAAGRQQLRETYDITARRNAQFSIGGQQQAFVEPWLPVAGDGDFAGYAARLAGALGASRHALVISAFHGYSFALWSRVRALFAPLWQRIGLPLTGAITTLFHGDYEATPTGVHKDRFTTMLFALSGRKRMRFWPARPWSEPVSTITQYDAYLASSFAVDVDPGDILYWPSSYYHVGEGLGGLATSVNVGIPIDEHRASYFLDDLLSGTIDDVDLSEAERRRGRLRPGRASPLAQGVLSAGGRLAPALPAALRGAVAQLQRLSTPSETQAQVRALWLARQSAAGFEPVPPPARRVWLRDDDRLRGDRAFPVLVAPERDHAERRASRTPWLCAANGHLLRVLGHPAVPALCAALASRRPRRVADLLQPFGAQSGAIRTLLTQLVAVGSLERLAPPPGRNP